MKKISKRMEKELREIAEIKDSIERYDASVRMGNKYGFNKLLEVNTIICDNVKKWGKKMAEVSFYAVNEACIQKALNN